MADAEVADNKPVRVPVPKATGEYIEVDTLAIPPEMWAEVIVQGLKQVLGRGMSKISKATYPDKAELKAAAVKKAQENLEAVMANDTKKIRLSASGGTKSAASGRPKAVDAEAMKIAKVLVKDEMKRAKIRIADYKAKEITEFAKEVLASRPDIYDQAEAAVKAREALPTQGIDLSRLKADPKLVAKNEAKKKQGEGQLSAKQAGKPKVRPKTGQPTASPTLQ